MRWHSLQRESAVNDNSVLLVVAVSAILLFVWRLLRVRSVQQYEPSELEGLMKKGGNIVLLDVRTDGERMENSIRGSLHIPLHVLRARLHELEKYRQSIIVCYCRSGNRSTGAALLLRKQGFAAANLRGGWENWKRVRR